MDEDQKQQVREGSLSQWFGAIVFVFVVGGGIWYAISDNDGVPEMPFGLKDKIDSLFESDYFVETICVGAEGQVRGGVVYLPNQEEPFTGKNICVYENGQKSQEGNYLDGKKEGKWTWWYENGQKKMEWNYLNAEEEGKFTWWYETGQKKREVNYKVGKVDGKWIEWRENGDMWRDQNWKDGEKID